MKIKNEGKCSTCICKQVCIGTIGLQRNCPGNVNIEDIHEDLKNGFHGIYEEIKNIKTI